MDVEEDFWEWKNKKEMKDFRMEIKDRFEG